MSDLASLFALLLTAVGLTVLVVWPAAGPSAWLRDRVVRRTVPAPFREVLDCYICCGFWCGLLLSPPAWLLCHQPWTWLSCLMTPAVFWVILRPEGAADGEHNADSK